MVRILSTHPIFRLIIKGFGKSFFVISCMRDMGNLVVPYSRFTPPLQPPLCIPSPYSFRIHSTALQVEILLQSPELQITDKVSLLTWTLTVVDKALPVLLCLIPLLLASLTPSTRFAFCKLNHIYIRKASRIIRLYTVSTRAWVGWKRWNEPADIYVSTTSNCSITMHMHDV